MAADRILMMKGSKRNALSIALVAIGAAAMYNWILSPQVGYLRAVQRYEPVVNEIAERTERVGATLDKKRRRLRYLQQELAEARDSLFTSAQAKGFLGSLQPFVEQSGCKVIAADFSGEGQTGSSSKGKEAAAVTTSRVAVTVVGSYDQTIALLDRLQTNRPKIWVESCSLKLSDVRTGRLECRLVLALHAVHDEEGHADE
ncbi:MAG: hypothetical protein JW955_05200 [Sedimentisphaerales bacterium]|nr:hypothetical protein [Sedimentisphaerales bacterium]